MKTLLVCAAALSVAMFAVGCESDGGDVEAQAKTLMEEVNKAISAENMEVAEKKMTELMDLVSDDEALAQQAELLKKTLEAAKSGNMPALPDGALTVPQP